MYGDWVVIYNHENNCGHVGGYCVVSYVSGRAIYWYKSLASAWKKARALNRNGR